MNIQSYIDRKREAGRKEHEGAWTDWAGWDYQQCWTAVVGELLDACAYCEHIREIGTKEDDNQLIREADEMIVYLTKALQQFGWSHLEAACQEAEQVQEPEGFMAELKRRSAEDIFKLCHPEKVNEVKQEAENG